MNKDLHISYGSITDVGLVKEFNTDAISEFKILNGHVFVVCDGHDGEEGHGALASKLIAESIKKYFFNRSYKDMVKALTNAITFANLTLFNQAQKESKYKGIGSTMAIIIYRDNKIYYAYAGDSRIYLFRNNQLKPLTQDHVNDPVNAVGADVNILLGKTKDIKFGVCKSPIVAEENDVFMLCTDGLTDQLSDDEILVSIGDADKSPEHKCQDLIEQTHNKGGEDCTSVQVLEFSQIIELKKEKAPFNFKPIMFAVLGIIAIVFIGFAGYKGYEAFKNRPIKKQKVEVVAVKKIKKDTESIKINTESEKEIDKIVESVLQDSKPKVKSEPVISKKKPITKNTNTEKVYYNHKIKYGENLYRLAIRYNITQKQLISLNGKKATNLVAGTNLKIPVKAVHIVKSGESYSVISDRYNVKIKTFCKASNIDGKTPLKENQTLIIPLGK